MSLNFYKFRKLKVLSHLAVAVLLISSCKSQASKQAANTNDVLGTYGSSTLKISELSSSEKEELYNAQKKVYEAAHSILEKRYLDTWFADYQSKNKLASLEEAKKDYFSKNVPVSDAEVQKFIQQNASNPQLQQIPVMERSDVIKQYLSRSGQEKAEQAIVAKAEQDNLVKVLGFEQPTAPLIKLTDSGYKLDPAATSPKVTIVEFADYQCPYCVKANAAIHEALAAYKGKGEVQFIFRDFPLISIHPQAMPAALAAKCAASQGKYWDMHTRIFDRSPMDPLSAESYTKFAKDLNLDMTKFTACQKDETQKTQVMADVNEGMSVGVNGTPTFFINGQKFEKSPDVASFKQEIDRRLAAK